MILPMENTEKMIFPGVGKYGIPEIKPETDIRMGGSKDGAIAGGAKRTIEARYIEGRGWQRGRYDTEVLEATTDGKGNLTFEYAQPDTKEKTAKTNKTNYLTYNVQAGAVDGKSFGINWDKVQSISGQTYSMRAEAKEHGLSWDGATKSWKRKK